MNENAPPTPDPNANNAPSPVVLYVGIGFGVLTLLFLIGLVIANMRGIPIPCASRMPIILIFSLTSAFSAGFVGGYLTASGDLSIPGMQGQPFRVGAAGGIGVLLVFPIVGWSLYVRGCTDEVVNPPLLRSATVTGTVVQFVYENSGIPAGYRIRPQFSANDSFSASIELGPAFDPNSAGEADVALPSGVKLPCWVRLAVYDRDNREVTNSQSEAKQLKEPNR